MSSETDFERPPANIARQSASAPGLRAPSTPGPEDTSPAFSLGWLAGLAMAPFGLVVGFTITALPFLLTRSGIPLDQVASISAAVMSPTFWGFLLSPIMDVGFSRKTHCWLTAGIAAVSLALAMWVLSPRHLLLATSLLLIAELAGVLFGSALSGWTAEFVPESLRGSVGGWTNVANLGGGAAGSLAVMELSRYWSARSIGAGLAVAVMAGTTPLLFFPAAKKPSFTLVQVFTGTMRKIWQSSTTRESLIGFVLFLAPASAVAAINLFSGLGPDFHAGAGTVILVTGLGSAITASVGSLLGGFLSSHLPRGHVYLSGGIAAGICALSLAFSPHTSAAFVAGVLLYNGIAGISYAAFTSLTLQLVGHRSAVASTQLALFAAATNGAIVFMTWADGRGYRYSGVRGLLTVDGVASIASAIPLLYLVHRQLRSRED